MASSEDTEITLGTGKLLLLFFGLVIMCALFFALGYSLGRKAEPGLLAASAAGAPQTTTAGNHTSGSAPAQPMTSYKSIEQKNASPDLTHSADPKTDPAAATPAPSNTPQAPPANPPDPTTTLPTAGYFVQVAAVTKQEDADALVDALKKKQYPAFVAPQSNADKYLRVQVGPFPDIKDAAAMRSRLIGDGYSPIVKK